MTLVRGGPVTEKVVFDHTVEGLFVRALGQKLSPRARQRLREAGLDLGRKLLPAYPFEVWITALRIAGEELYPTTPLDDAQFKLGQQLIDGYRETLMGRAVLGMIRVLGPRRTLLRAQQSFRSGNNYTETRVKELSATSAELWLNEVGPYPTFTAGIVHQALAATGVSPLVEIAQHDGHECNLRVTWAAAAKSA